MKRSGGKIGGYKVLGHWSSGWASHVYLARRIDPPDDNNLYALKVPRTEYAIYAASKSGFMRGNSEPPKGAHDNVISTRDLIDRHGRLYMVTDFVHGELLSKVAEARGMPFHPALAVSMARDVAKALVYLESQGPESQLHGELCPQSVMLSYDGHVKLLDSGIINVKPRPVKDHYLSPEEAAELPELDLRSDIYALGLILWEMLTGRQALDGKNQNEIRAAALAGRMGPPSQAGVASSPELDAIVMKALAVDREARFQTMTELLEVLDGYLAVVAPGYDSVAEVREMLGTLFPARAEKLARLLDRWENVEDEPTAANLDLPGSPLQAIEDAFRSRHLSVTPRPSAFSELDATLSALSQDPSNTLPPLTPMSRSDSNLEAIESIEEVVGRADSTSGDATISHTDISPSSDIRAMRLQQKRKNALRIAWALGVATVLMALGTVWILLQPSPVGAGTLTVTSQPVGAQVMVNGTNWGGTPLDVPGLALNQKHEIRVEHEGYETHTRQLTLSEGQPTKRLDVKLEAEEATPKDSEEGYLENPYD